MPKKFATQGTRRVVDEKTKVMAVGPNQVTRPIDEALCQRKHHLECLIKENGWMWCTHKTKETNHYDGDSSSLMVERHFVKKNPMFSNNIRETYGEN